MTISRTQRDLDHDPAAHLARRGCPARPRSPRRGGSSWSWRRASPGRDRRRGAARPRAAAASAPSTESMPRSATPRRMNGATEVGRSMPPASPQAAIGAAIAASSTGGSRASSSRPSRCRPPSAPWRAGLPGPDELVAVDDLGRAEAPSGSRPPAAGRSRRSRASRPSPSSATATEPTPPAAPVTTAGPSPGRRPCRSRAMRQSIAV